ncbi:hypothetical protein [Thalassotalea sp. G2M2-11]|uniref:hypothetical protein n=1 Tax=Thalassotalea sp. G2M2-11 TaxID=2787627 RepID=UPI0019D10615|nr:hypothetical protein [Thalassotalea sp. G2M2-11]
MNKLSNFIVSVFIIVGLCACGGGGGGGGNSNTPSDPYTPDQPDSPSVVFPSQSSTPTMVTLAEQGVIYTTDSGLSLYFFDNDSAGSSACNAEDGAPAGGSNDSNSCAALWPPLLADSGAQASGDFTLITRADGTMQWAWHDYPLYSYINDSAEGDTNGDGLNDIWHLARPIPVTTSDDMVMGQLVASSQVLMASMSNNVIAINRMNKDGFSLYTFDQDSIDQINCLSENCINNWPPLVADQGARTYGKFSTIDHGEYYQWAYNGIPLYLFANDNAAGDMLGDGVADVWHLASTAPAIFRMNQAGTLLTSTGITHVLAEDSEGSGNFVDKQTNQDQFTLYIFDNDDTNVSNCSGSCAVNWPPFLAQDSDSAIGDFDIFTRDDGHRQWSYLGDPLYFYIGDTDKGQANGDGINGVWHVIDPIMKTQFMAQSNTLGEVLTVKGMTSVLMSDGNGGFEAMTEDKTGFALYIFNQDTQGVSNCNSDSCIAAWPPLLATDDDTAMAPFSIINRMDGNKQWAINGKPLYFYTPDTSATDVSGEGVNNIWYVARPAPVRVYSHDPKGDILVANGELQPSMGKTADELKELTLYTFNSDVKDSGESACFDDCAQTWPPLYASDNDQPYGLFTIIDRVETDNTNTRQWAYKGKPLYFYTPDSQLGDTYGDYPGWPLARP